ncbi:MAG: hypothetical protein U0163_20385 [Gemmatimonadaceae bacterium]
MNALRGAAHAFFASPTDPVYAIIEDVELLWTPGGNPATDVKTFDGMARVAAARGTADQSGTGADGEAVITGFIGCNSSTSYPSDLDQLDVAIDHGLVEVRGGTKDPTGPALGFDAVPGSRTPKSPEWGGEATAWATTLPQRSLVFGYERPVSSFTNEPPVTNHGVPFTGFELSAFPGSPTFPASAPLVAGICIDPFVYGFSRLLHNALPASSILGLTALSFCTGSGSTVQGLGGVGGSLSGLSPSGAVLVTPRSDVVVFTQQPVTRSCSRSRRRYKCARSPRSAHRSVASRLSTDVQPVRRSVQGHAGQMEPRRSWHLRIPVAGTYTITVTGTLGELPLISSTSRSFRIRA